MPSTRSSHDVSNVDLPSPSRLEIGSLAWVDSERVHAEDLLVNATFRFLTRPGAVSAETAREIGRAMGRETYREGMDEFLHAFSHLGVGGLDIRENANGRYVFVGRDLAVEKVPNPPVCAVALGFLEGMVGATTGHAALGAEITCRGRGQSECRFFVMERR